MLRVLKLDSNKLEERDTRLISYANHVPDQLHKQELINIGKEAFLNDRDGKRVLKKMAAERQAKSNDNRSN